MTHSEWEDLFGEQKIMQSLRQKGIPEHFVKELVLKLGNAFEGAFSDPESICEEIKNTLKEEIAAKLISARNIEIYCPDKWKRKTRPKNEKTSFSCIQEDNEKHQSKQLQ